MRLIHNTSNPVNNTLHSAEQLIRMKILAINLVIIFGVRSFKSFAQIVYMYFFTKRRVGLADTEYDLIDPTPPTPPILDDGLDGDDAVDVDYDDAYAGNSPSNRLNIQSINPAAPRKKPSKRRLSSIYGKRRNSYEYTNEVVKEPSRGRDLDNISSFWSSFRNNGNDNDNSKSNMERDSNSRIPFSRGSSRNVPNDVEESNASPPSSPMPASHQLGTGTYQATRTNYDISYREMNRVERDYELKEWNPALENIKLYSDLLIGFGYVVIFGCLLPGISILGVLDIYLVYKKDAFRFINVYRRIKSIYRDGDDNTDSKLGNLYYLTFNTFLSITFITNALLIIFTMINFDFLKLSVRLWIFIAINGSMFVYRHFAMLMLTNEPDIVNIQRLRTNFLSKKLIEKTPDEEADPTSIL